MRPRRRTSPTEQVPTNRLATTSGTTTMLMSRMKAVPSGSKAKTTPLAPIRARSLDHHSDHHPEDQPQENLRRQLHAYSSVKPPRLRRYGTRPPASRISRTKGGSGSAAELDRRWSR